MKAWVGGQAPAFLPAVGEVLLPLEDVAEQVWASERAKSGKHPWQWIEFEVDRCRHVWGQAPCTASGAAGTECHNSWETCQDPPNFSAEPFWMRCAEAVANAPRIFEFEDDGLPVFLPLLRSVEHSPTMPDPGESLGLRVNLNVQLDDAPHHDIGIDKYIAGRSYDAMRQGTMLRKVKARFPHYIGRRLRWYQGYITGNPTLADFRKREYVMERFEGPDAKGRVRIIAKDVLKLLDNKRAQAPMPSQGSLVADMAIGDNPTQLDVATSEPAEYDLKSDETVDYVRIGEEVFTYTGTTSITDGVRLTGFSRTAPAPYSTTKAGHDADDLVQRCRYFSGSIGDVVEELMVDYGGIAQVFIPKGEWDTEITTWLADETISRLVTEPEGVQELIEEIIRQTLTWAFWFDELGQKIRYRALRPVDLDEEVVAITDDANLVADSIKIVDEPDKLVNEVQVLYAQIDAVKDDGDVENYRKGIVVVDGDSQSVNETRQRRVKRIFARWHPASNEGALLRFATRSVAARARNLMTVEFELERKDEDIGTAQFADLTTLYIIDQFGAPHTTRVQVMRVDAAGERVKYRAREDFFKARFFGRLAPGELSGLQWASATDEQKERYLFWAQTDGTMTDGDSGKGWA